MEEMMEAMMGSMSKEDKMDMMGKMMEKFFADMTVEDKQKIMEQMMPRMMEGINMMDMMPKMMIRMMDSSNSEGGIAGMMSPVMGGGHGREMPMMPQMMMGMMPRCLEMMLPNIPEDKRSVFVLEMVASLVKQGSAGMGDEEKEDFVAKVVESVRT